MRVTLDFETRSACDLKACGAWVYSQHPTTEVLCLCWSIDGGPVQTWRPGDPIPQDLIEAALSGALMCAHNAAFEKAVWTNLMVPVYGWPDCAGFRWFDTLASCAYRSLPLDLEGAGRVLGLAVQKDMEGAAVMKRVSIANKKTGEFASSSEEDLRKTALYCADDVRAQDNLLLRVGTLPKREYDIWLVDQKMNERGIRIDLDYVRASQTLIDLAMPDLKRDFTALTGIEKAGSTAKVKAWLETQGVVLPDLRRETLEDYMAGPMPPEVADMLHMRNQITSSSVKKLEAMRNCTGADGRARFLQQYHAASTGRWAGRILQPHNFPRGSVEFGTDEDGNPVLSPEVLVPLIMAEDPDLIRMTLTSTNAKGETVPAEPVAAVSSGLRHALLAADGHKFIAADFSTIEARVVLAMAGQDDKVDLLRTGADIYCAMASDIYKRPINKKEHPSERQTGKNAVLGLGFSMGAATFRARYAKRDTVEFAEKVVKVYRKEFAPKVPHLWYALEEASAKCVWDGVATETHGIRFALEDGWLTMRLPSGKKLWYFNPQRTTNTAPWDEDEVRPGWKFQAKKAGAWRTIHAYGGLLTENAVQATARDILADRMLALDREGIPLVLTVHDENVVEVLESFPLATVEEIMLDTEDWVRDLGVPIAVECWEGDRYRK